MIPQFRFQDGKLWWRDHLSSLGEMKRMRVQLADADYQWRYMSDSSADLIKQIDEAIRQYEAQNA